MANLLSDDDVFGSAPSGLLSDADVFGKGAKKEPGGFVASAKQAIGATVKGAGQAAADFIPGVSQENALKRYGQEIIEANPTAVHSFSDLADKPWTAVKEATGNALSSMGGVVGSRALGMGITAAAPFTGPAAPVVAGAGQAISWLGPVAAAALPSFGGIREQQIHDDPNAANSAAAKAAAAVGAGTVGAIESRFGPEAWGSKMLTEAGRKEVAKLFAAKTLPQAVAKGAVRGAAVEGAEELAQNPVEQLAAFQNPLTAEALKDTAFSGAMGALGGGVLGGGTGAASRYLPKKPDVDPGNQPAEPPKALPAPTYTGTPGDQTLQATVDRQNAVDAAQAAADAPIRYEPGLVPGVDVGGPTEPPSPPGGGIDFTPPQLPDTGPLSRAANLALGASVPMERQAFFPFQSFAAAERMRNGRDDLVTRQHPSIPGRFTLVPAGLETPVARQAKPDVQQGTGSFSDQNELANFIADERKDQSVRKAALAEGKNNAIAQADQAVADARQFATRNERLSILDGVLSSLAPGQNPNRRFDAALKAAGFRDTSFTEEERAVIGRYGNVASAFAVAPEASVEPSSPGEIEAAIPAAKGKGDSGIAGVRADRVRSAIAAGFTQRKGFSLINPATGEKFALKTPGMIRAAKEALEKLSATNTENRSDENTSMATGGGEEQRPEQIGSQGNLPTVAVGVGPGDYSVAETSVPSGEPAVSVGDGSERNAALSEQKSTAKPRRTRMTPLDDPRISKHAESLQAMAGDVGLAETGGLLLRDANGNANGRTQWIPHAEWFRAGMIGRPEDAMKAVQKAVSGEPMSVKEKRTIQGMMDWLDHVDAHPNEAEALADMGYDDLTEPEQEARDALGDFDPLNPPVGDVAAGMRALGFTEEEIRAEIEGSQSRDSGQGDGVDNGIAGRGPQESLPGRDETRPSASEGQGPDERPSLELERQTDQGLADKAAREQEPQEPTKEQADRERDAAPFSLSEQSQPKPQGVQSGLFTADGRVSVEAKQPEKPAEVTKPKNEQQEAAGLPAATDGGSRPVPAVSALEETFRPLIERLIRNKRVAKELGFDIDGAIAKAKAAMAGTKQMPGSFRALAKRAEKKGDTETAAILNQIADLNDGRKAKTATVKDSVTTESIDNQKTVGNSVDSAAHEAASSPTNSLVEPTQAQKEAGNYAKGHVRIAGLDISIENPEGSTRSGTDKGGKSWSVTMKSHYGYLKGTIGKDKDHIDVFVKPGTAEDYAGDVFIIDQKNAAGGFDEHKVMLGWGSQDAAVLAYKANYTPGWDGIQAVTPMSMEQFKGWLENGNHNEPAAASGKTPLQQDIAKLKPNVELKKGDRFKDGHGKTWEVWTARTSLVEAFPVIDGKIKVSRDDGVRFATDERARLANPEARTDVFQLDSGIGSEPITDFGEKLGGARKDDAAALRDAVSRELSDEELATQPLSKIWPKESIDEIEDPFIAVVAHAARAEIPAKPRVAYKVAGWVGKVKVLRGLASAMLNRGIGRDFIEKYVGEHRGLRHFAQKVALLEMIGRENWDRIGKVEAFPEAYRYAEDGTTHIPAPHVYVEVDGKAQRYNAKRVDDVVESVRAILGEAKPAAKIEFEIRGREGSYFINKKGDPLYRKLKTFDSVKEASEFRNAHYDDLVSAWESVKESDNVKETDVRSKENRPRSAEDWRKGKDVPPEQFASEFGFRGVEWGNWVSQGTGAKDRQGMLNQAYDALMDLADIIGVPPKALSLNGSLGIGFGSRGHGWASAHFEPSNLVINLTKTRGAGALAHEWFHALDNYFQTMRGKPSGAKVENWFITYNPENYYVHKQSGQKLPARAFEQMIVGEKHPIYGVIFPRYRDRSQWELKEGVRPKVGEAFADLVKALNDSPMAKRASLIDKGKSGGYWSRIIERGARSFENYVISKMMEKGYHNDYLANVRPVEDFPRSKERYPYLLPEEVKPIAEAFDSLFSVIESRETEKGVALESRATSFDSSDAPQTTMIRRVVDSFLAHFKGAAALDIRVVASRNDIPQRYRPSPYAEGVYHDADGVVYLISSNLPTQARAWQVLMHEAIGHYGLSNLMGEKFAALQATILQKATSGRELTRHPQPGEADYATVEAVRRLYPEASDSEVAQEVLARMAEMMEPPGWSKILFAQVRHWLRTAARAMNLTVEPSLQEAKDAVVLAAKHLRDGKNLEREMAGDGQAFASEGAPRLAPNGKPSNLTPEQWERVRTPAFKAWFGDWEKFATAEGGVWADSNREVSKVVDTNGEPLVVFHGATEAGFSVFEPARNPRGTPAVFFSDNSSIARTYSGRKAGEAVIQDDREPGVYSVFLNIRNPHEEYFDGANWDGSTNDLFEVLDSYGDLIYAEDGRRFLPRGEAEDLAARNDGAEVNPAADLPFSTNTAVEEAAKYKNDGAILHDVVDNGPQADVWEASKVFAVFNPEQIKSAIGNRGAFDGANPNILESRSSGPAQWQAPEPSRLDDLIYSMQDKHVDLKRVVQSIKKTAGSIADNIDPYLQEELFHGRAAKAVQDFLDLELRPLIAEMRMRGVEMADFEEYLWNRHAEERNAQIAKINPQMPDGGSGLATADARAYLAGLSSDKRKAYESLAAKIDAITARNRQVLVDSGLEKAETVAAWEGAYKHYVPLQREDVETGGNGTGQGFSVRGTSSKRAVGSGRPVADIIANLAMQRERFIVKAEKNRVSIAIAGLAVSNPNPDFWKIDDAPKERVVETIGGQDQVVERTVPSFRTQENVVHFRLNGEDHFVIFNEREPRAMRMAQSIKNLDMDQLGRVLTVAGKVTRYFAAINTQYNPIFGIINLFRDVQGALLNLSTTPLAGEQKRVAGYTVDALRGIYADIRAHRAGKVPSSRWASLYEEFQNEGGQTGYRDQFSNAEQRAEAIAKEIKAMDRNAAFKAAGAVFDWLSDYNQAMENAVRLAAYAAAKERGLSKQQAASLAKNLTVNFNRKGQVATQMGALYAFFNASMQGTARLAQTLTGPMGRRIITGGILLGSMQALLLASAGMGDDEPPEFVRERNLILPIGDGKYISLPMPLGFHVLPNLGRIPVEFVMSGFREPARRISDLVAIFADTFNPIGNAGLSLQTIAPTVVDPFAALAENKDWTGKPIAKMDMNANSPTPGHNRAKDTSTVWSKSIAEAINYLSGGTKYKPGVVSPTPDQIDYLIGQVTGGVGREAAKAEQTVTSTIFTGEELPLHKVPLVGRFVGDTKGQSAEGSKFYAALQRINEHENEIKGMRKDGRGAEIAGYIQDNPEARLMLYSNHVEREVQKLRAAKRDALERGDEGRVRMIESALTAKMRAFNERVRSAQGSAN